MTTTNGIRRRAKIQLARIAAATCAVEAIKAECSGESLVLGLEAMDKLTELDVNNMLVVFQAALAKRLHELGAH